MRGATGHEDVHLASRLYFNPRTPCGVRLGTEAGMTTSSDFNPRTPCGVRPRILRASFILLTYFNPRTPCGVRLNVIIDALWSAIFQSTHPMRGATDEDGEETDVDIISIHAPHAGCDRTGLTRTALRGISIHAPHAGCDEAQGREFQAKLFQSTHPMRGATCPSSSTD